MFLVEAYKIPTVVNTIGASVNGHKPVSEPDILNNSVPKTQARYHRLAARGSESGVTVAPGLRMGPQDVAIPTENAPPPGDNMGTQRPKAVRRTQSASPKRGKGEEHGHPRVTRAQGKFLGNVHIYS